MTNDIVFDYDLTLKLIDWYKVISPLTNFCCFDSTKKKLLDIPTTCKSKRIKHQYHLYQEFEDFYINFDSAIEELLNKFDADFEYDKKISYIKKDGVLNLQEINQFALLIEYSIDIKHYLNTRFDNLKLQKFTKFIKEFRKFVAPNGEIDYFKHPLIRKTYEELLTIESTIRKSISTIINREDIKNKLQFSNYDIINDRYVIPLRSDSYQSNIGQIISRSDTGRTLFVEPFELRDLSNNRLELLNKIDELLNQICRSYCQGLAPHSDDLTLLTDVMYESDYFNSLFCYYKNQVFCVPEISTIPTIVLNDFYHPLIKDAVTNVIDINKEHTGLVISGPNMGGKTATLKAISISYLFFIKGIKLPCREAKLYPYKRFFYFGHDDQSLMDGESSFSSEVKSYTHMLNSLNEDNLIIIDEIFNTTSSEEASALAIAIFNHIDKHSDSHVLISTHHQMLKSFLFENKSFLSCHVGFLEDEHRPNYKLYFDGPGSSHAIEIFRRLTKKEDFSKKILDQAENILDKKFINYEMLLRDLSYKNGLLDKKINDINSLKNHLENQKKANDGLLKLKLDKELEAYRSKMDKIVNDAYKIKKSEETHKTRVKQLESLKSKHFRDESISPTLFEISSGNKSEIKLEIDKSYYCQKVQAKVVIKKLDFKKKIATVSKKNITIRVPFNTLSKNKVQIDDEVKVHVSRSAQQATKLEYDCRGMRATEFESFVGTIISGLYTGDVPFIDIIHGHGDGTLKKVMREFLQHTPDICSENKEDGNDGTTRIILKN
jgi:DNA mismatch repair protein MutS2